MRGLRIKSLKMRLLIGVIVLIVFTFTIVGCASQTPPPRSTFPAVSTAAYTAAHYASGEEVVVTMTWTFESNCAACHENEDIVNNSGSLAAKHVENVCADCHSDDAALRAAHVDLVQALRAEPPTELTESKLDASLCISCHNPDEFKAATVGALVDEERNQFNPHDIRSFPEHDSVLCMNCHPMHGEDNPLRDAKNVCDSCHHMGIYRACSSAGCHDEDEH
jgi:mono/diheme cytochrome c family protein